VHDCGKETSTQFRKIMKNYVIAYEHRLVCFLDTEDKEEIL